ncbi:MerR family transcriptional regulator [Paraburkholderia sp. LEh10]|uniref:MerR family transcriptional regulator n=1 Tax=Paraburkholderia sp. LEh10 TaxID=2821353 RepID=UPI001AE98192|nr:MerR family transcriptional regulator [Paraburkholderia sp. LEh10]MBP0591230.1 MerR family transcriptional regulator [Paraburkholderia sp. LEh10]
MIKTVDDPEAVPRYRIGAVARMANLPVGTLRIWERRYGVVAPPTTQSGHRLYSDADVRRVAMIKGLVDRGYAIGSIASLQTSELERLAFMHVDKTPMSPLAEGPPGLRLRIVGSALAHTIRQHLHAMNADLASEPKVFENMTAAFAERMDQPTDALIIHLPSLHADDVERVLALSASTHAENIAVVYSFAAASTLGLLERVGVRAVREPLDQASAAQMMADIQRKSGVAADQPDTREPAPQRHYSDEALMAMAQASTTIACECPKHLASIIMQLSAFEQYSVSCASRTPADALLHVYLANISGRARAMFEHALLRLEREERWVLENR